MTMAKILVPFNFEPHERQVFDFIINNFANREQIKVTIFSTYVSLPELDYKETPELGKMRGGVIFLAQELQKKEAGLRVVKDFLVENGFSDDSVDYVLKKAEKDTAGEIIDAALNGHYDIIVFRPVPGKIRRMFGPSVHEKVSRALKNVTVCIVR